MSENHFINVKGWIKEEKKKYSIDDGLYGKLKLIFIKKLAEAEKSKGNKLEGGPFFDDRGNGRIRMDIDLRDLSNITALRLAVVPIRLFFKSKKSCFFPVEQRINNAEDGLTKVINLNNFIYNIEGYRIEILYHPSGHQEIKGDLNAKNPHINVNILHKKEYIKFHFIINQDFGVKCSR